MDKTQRDRFAAAALSGILAGSDAYQKISDASEPEFREQLDHVAIIAYDIADAMMNEREHRDDD